MHLARVCRSTEGENNGILFLRPIDSREAALSLEERSAVLADYKPKSDSFFIHSYIKCGTHWLWEVMQMLLMQKAEVSSLNKEQQFIEMVMKPEDMQSPDIPLIYNTHIEPKHLPDKFKSLKTVHIIRNPKDVMVSAYYHLKSMNNSSGPNINKADDIVPWSWDEHFELWMKTAAGELVESWWDFHRQVWDIKDTENRLILFYEDFIHEFQREVRKVVKFMGVEASDALLLEIEHATTIANIKKRKLEHGNSFIIRLFREGKIGGWKSHFTVSQNEQFNEVHSELMRGYEDLNKHFIPYI